jgi:hypothetical protein
MVFFTPSALPQVATASPVTQAAPPVSAAPAAQAAPVAAPQQQSPKTIILPITGTIIKNFDIDPKKFYFELPFYDQDKYDELLNDFERGTDLIHWASNVYVGDTADTGAIFTFKEPENITQTDLEQDYKMLDQLIKVYLIYNTRQKSTPVAAQPAATQTNVANLDSVNLGDPYFLLTATQCQVYVDVIFNVPSYYIFITGQEEQTSMVVAVMDFLNKSKFVTKNTPTTIKIKQNPSLIRIQFELVTQNLDEQEIFFQGLDYILSANGYLKPYK